MNDLNTLFRERIGFPENETITFEKLDLVLEKTATTIPFENLCIIAKNTREFTKENIINKILIRKEGGLCYDLNTLLYYFLFENGFNVVLVRGVIFNQANQEWSQTGKTHVTILLTYKEQMYIIDTGFGGNLPLKPVPLNGKIVTSNNGEFRAEKWDNEHGNYIFKMKLKYKNMNWQIGYAFDSRQTVRDVAEINGIQRTISEHPHSPFNKLPLITRMTDGGNLTLTDTSLTQWIKGEILKEQVDSHRFKELANKYFEMELQE